jgi:porphobilinogen synthase
MMDGVIQALRSALDGAGYASLPLLGYSVKYHSSFYSPFRAVSGGAPRMGDRSGYQMDASNVLEALRETALDVQEGADLLMVKPAHAYLDVIARVKQAHPHMPLGAYHTSGECALLRAAAERGWVDEEKAVCEVLQAIRRAGADFIFTYYAKSFARWMRAKTSSGVPEQSTVCTSCP